MVFPAAFAHRVELEPRAGALVEPTSVALHAVRRGRVGGQRVLVLRALRQNADRSAPPYYQWILGGDRNLRGFKAGTAVGDTLVAASAALRAPLSSPLRVAKLGVNIFVDTGVTYNKGQRLTDQPFETGAGAGVWLAAAVVQLHLEVAHGFGAGTRAHFGMGFAF